MPKQAANVLLPGSKVMVRSRETDGVEAEGLHEPLEQSSVLVGAHCQTTSEGAAMTGCAAAKAKTPKMVERLNTCATSNFAAAQSVLSATRPSRKRLT